MHHGTILIADDEELIRRVLADTLREQGHSVETVDNGALAWDALSTKRFDLALLDIRMPEQSGLDILAQLQKTQQDAQEEAHAGGQLQTAIIIMTGLTTLDNAIEAMKRGAFDYLTKPFDLEEVKAMALRALEVRRMTQTQPASPFAGAEGRNEQIIGYSSAMQQVYKTIGRIVKSDATVLLQGESGTGKELVARVIHHHSTRWRAPFIGVNCSASPAD
jgi:DNA-binding NtrC family response regulator